MFSTINLTSHLEKIDTDRWTQFTFPNLWPDLLENAKIYDNSKDFKSAGISADGHLDNSIRNDKIHWLSQDTTRPSEKIFLSELVILQNQLKNYFRISLENFECHYAEYPVGHFYKRHSDQKSQDNKRQFSFVYYLNPVWLPDDGGELVAYNKNASDQNSSSQELFRLRPEGGTFVLFRSDIEHEVLPSKRSRRSIAGWMRTL